MNRVWKGRGEKGLASPADVFRGDRICGEGRNTIFPKNVCGEAKDGPDPAFLFLFHENLASRLFFIAFPNDIFLKNSNCCKTR